MALRLALALLLGLVAGLAALTGPGARLERDLGLRLLYGLRGEVAVPQEAAILAIDRAGVDWLRFEARAPGPVKPHLADCLTPPARAALGETFGTGPLPRAVYACALERLAAAGARLVVLDVLFAKTDAADARLAAALAALPTLLFERVEPAPELPGVMLRHSPREVFAAAARGTGLSLIEAPAGGFLEGYLSGIAGHPGLRDLASLAVAEISGRPLPPAGPPQTRPVWFYGPPASIAHLGLPELLAAAGPPAWLAGRTVFVGLSDPETPGLPDHFRVPLPGSDGRAMAGVEIMATAFLNGLSGERMVRPPPLALAGIVAGFAALAFAAALLLPGKRGLQAGAALGAGWVLIAGGAFLGARLWLPVALPLGLLGLAGFVALALRYLMARRVIGRLAPPAWASDILDRRRGTERVVRAETATVLVCDVVGSTAIGRGLGNAAFKGAMEGFYDMVSAPIEAAGGLIAEYPGDATFAVFPESVAGPDHAVHAVRAARAAIAAAERRVAAAAGADDPLRLRIALNTGPAEIGDIGTDRRSYYRAVGETVTQTFAIERRGKALVFEGPAICLLSAATVAAAGLAPTEVEDLGTLVLAGQEQVRLYRLLP
ncbi:hypothetical protein LNKW23_03630 [Paralimibaculum aggregatum]|uniref:Guanylate cyclase domain-containing protein n=1 Tax=Paralimibaculum aggregatum TaxID=3036245 RepID=A0ABQ6LCR8_9RHOB|nr:CHASE2 domain-containing protein [Limibaculum sp. NKW23]GMG81151.1 hypothetical protein LNKW23_03630 [Limibaculum sp. NKW23]